MPKNKFGYRPTKGGHSPKAYHITCGEDGNWVVKQSGSSHATARYSNKESAVNHARKIARAQNSKVIIHSKSGRIQGSHAHGTDPHPPMDTRQKDSKDLPPPPPGGGSAQRSLKK